MNEKINCRIYDLNIQVKVEIEISIISKNFLKIIPFERLKAKFRAEVFLPLKDQFIDAQPEGKCTQQV
jgi:hypothetical protein